MNHFKRGISCDLTFIFSFLQGLCANKREKRKKMHEHDVILIVREMYNKYRKSTKSHDRECNLKESNFVQ